MGQCFSPAKQATSDKYDYSTSNTNLGEETPMEFWTITDVHKWLSELKNGSFIVWADKFQNELEINGLMLRGINKNYLKEINMTHEDRAYILKARDLLINCNPASTPITATTSTLVTLPSMATGTLSIGIPITPLHDDEDNNVPAATYEGQTDVNPLKITASCNTPEPEEKLQTLHDLADDSEDDLEDELDPNLLDELIQIALSESSFHKSISQYQQNGLMSPKLFTAKPGHNSPKGLNANQIKQQITSAQDFHLNIYAKEFEPRTGSHSAPNIFTIDTYNKKLCRIDEYETVQSSSNLAEHKKQRHCVNWKRFGAKGNIEISRKLTEEIIPDRINGKIPHLFEYMDKVTMLQKENEYKSDDLRVFNYDFYDKNTNESLYCIADVVVFGKKGSFKWKMREMLYTEKEIKKEIGNKCHVPQSWRHKCAFVEDTNEQKMVEDMIVSYADPQPQNITNHMMSKCKWTKKYVHCKKNNKQRIILAINKEQFEKKVKAYIEMNVEDVNTIPILVLNDSRMHVEYVYIVRIVYEPDIDIGIGYKVVNNRVQISRIYVDAMDILNAHLLLKPHDCNCLNGFKTIIDVLKIGNPDDEMNRIKDLRKKWNDAKSKIEELQRISSLAADNNGLDAD